MSLYEFVRMAAPPPTVAELRAQRELVARHLAWLDRQLALAEGTAPAPPPAANPPETTGAVVPAVPATATGNATATPNDDDTERLLAELAENEPRFNEGQMKAGCIVVAIVVILLVLGTIWGLPYLIYGEPAEPPPAENASAPSSPEPTRPSPAPPAPAATPRPAPQSTQPPETPPSPTGGRAVTEPPDPQTPASPPADEPRPANPERQPLVY